MNLDELPHRLRTAIVRTTFTTSLAMLAACGAKPSPHAAAPAPEIVAPARDAAVAPVEVVDVPKPHAIALSGRVVDTGGAGLAGAVVALSDRRGKIASVATADAGGRFRIPTTSGRWAISAHHPDAVGGFLAPHDYEDDVADLRLALGQDGGVTVRGTAISADPLPAGTTVTIARISNQEGDVFAAPVAPDGAFTARLPDGQRYVATLAHASFVGEASADRVGDQVELSLPVTHLLPAPPEITTWLGTAGAPLASTDPAHALDDLAPLGAMVGSAHLVGLGEATHGTREFFQLKHRVLEYLVAEKGFTVFGIEANQPECRAINEYVLHGTGDARAALAGIYIWTWDTEEVLAMIEWMRTWNADPKHAHKVQFVGFDMQTTKLALANVAAFVKRVAPDAADAWLAPLAVFGGEDEALASAKPDDQRKATAGLAALVGQFDRHAAAWRKAAGRATYDDARQDLHVIEQASAMSLAADGNAARDRAMAENVEAILARQPKGTRMALWAHNGHVDRSTTSYATMGSHLAQRLGKDYVVFGFVFGQGSFQAIDWTKTRSDVLDEHTLAAPPEVDLSVPFTHTGHPLLVADLRRATGAVATWFAAPHPMRENGGVFSTEEAMTSMMPLSTRFDAVIFVDKTTRARPLPEGERPAKTK